MGAIDLVDWPADKALVLSGSAGALRIPLALRNDSTAPVRLAEASLADVRLAGDGPPLRLEPVPIQMTLAANGVTHAQVRLRLDPATPPGRYTGEVRLAELTRTVTVDVLPQVKLDIRLDPVVIDAAAGRDQRFAVAFENRGNIPLILDLTGAYPLGEEAPIPADRLDGADLSANPLAAIFDRVLARTPRPALAPFGELALAMPDGPVALQPGEAGSAQVAVKLPDTLASTARYHLFAPLYAADLHLIIVTAAKPRGPKPPRRTKGASV